MKKYLTFEYLKYVLFGLFLGLFIGCFTDVFAAPFLTSDPYVATDTQPTSFTVVLNGTTYTSAPVKDANGLNYLKFDLAGKWATGNNSVKVSATNMWGTSVYTSPLAFPAGAPAVPSGVGLSAQ